MFWGRLMRKILLAGDNKNMRKVITQLLKRYSWRAAIGGSWQLSSND